MADPSGTEPDLHDNPEWRDVLLGTHRDVQRLRRVFRHMPADPRCKLCYAPQGGFGPIVSLFGYGKYPANPQLCRACFRSARKHPGGATVEITALFADIRGSTSLAEQMTPSKYSAAVTDYVRVASRAIREHGGIVDKLLGDGVMALFMAGFTGGEDARKATDAGRRMLREVQVPVGIGIHTGDAWVGFVDGADGVMDFTALGDAVNVASRLGAEARAGELLLSAATAAAAGLQTDGLEARRLELRGRAEPLDAFAERVNAALAAQP